jgi:ABC-type uncharacterized transport system substrate-binding protein
MARPSFFEVRDADSNFERLPELANELVQLPVDVLVTAEGTPATMVARQATTVIPIVFVVVTDPVEVGLVASLAHPGGNLTGNTNAPPTVFAKQLQILAQLVPRLSRVAIVLDSYNNPGMTLRLQATMTAANALGVQVKALDVRSREDVEAALAEALTWQAEAMMSFGGPGAVTDATPRLVDFELQNRMSYGIPQPGVCAGRWPSVLRHQRGRGGPRSRDPRQ